MKYYKDSSSGLYYKEAFNRIINMIWIIMVSIDFNGVKYILTDKCTVSFFFNDNVAYGHLKSSDKKRTNYLNLN